LIWGEAQRGLSADCATIAERQRERCAEADPTAIAPERLGHRASRARYSKGLSVAGPTGHSAGELARTARRIEDEAEQRALAEMRVLRSAGNSYRGIRGAHKEAPQDAHYAPKVEIRSCDKRLAGPIVVCDTIAEFSSTLADHTLAAPRHKLYRDD
jgi:hypothetical protein